MTDSTAPTVKHQHPIRGFFWGLLFGIGLAFVLVFATVIELSIANLAIVTFVGLALGVAWGIVGPAKAPSGPPPVERTEPALPVASRFDDFDAPPAPPDTNDEAGSSGDDAD